MKNTISSFLEPFPDEILEVKEEEKIILRDNFLLNFFQSRRIKVSDVIFKVHILEEKCTLEPYIIGSEGLLPHVMPDGKVCLNKLFSGALTNGHALLTDCVNYVRSRFKILVDSNLIHEDFKKEAQAHWNLSLPDHYKSVWFAKPPQTSSPLIADALGSRTSDTFLFCPELARHLPEIVSLEEIANKLSLKTTNRMKGLYLPLLSIPCTAMEWPETFQDLRTYVCDRVGKNFEKPIFQKKKNNLWLILLYHKEAGCFAYFMDVRTERIERIKVHRVDDEWTVGRDQNSFVLRRNSRPIILVGAGCLGSWVSNLLACQGVHNVHIFDGDKLLPQNLGRHLLPATYLKQNKATALVNFLSSANLFFKGCDYPKSFSTNEPILKELDWNSDPIFLNFTGEPGVISIIEKVRLSHPRSWHILAYYEPFVANAHCVISPPHQFLDIDKNLIKLINLTVFTPNVYKSEPGCISTFQSYELKKAAIANSLIADQILDVIDGKISNRMVLSLLLRRESEISSYIVEDKFKERANLQWIERSDLKEIWKEKTNVC